MDQHGIQLNNLISTKSANFRKMYYDKFCDNWMFLDWKLEHSIRKRLSKKKENVIVIHYQIFGNECCITEVTPRRIGEHWESIKLAYNIVNHVSTQKITNIENRTLGRVSFKAIE